MECQFNKDQVTYNYNLYFEKNEEIFALNKPIIKSFFLNEIKNKILEIVTFVGIILMFHLIAYLFKCEYLWKETIIFFSIITIFSFGKSIYEYFKLRKTVYILTNQRIIIHSNSNTKSINIHSIRTKELKKTFIDKQYLTANILIFTGETRDNDGKTEKVYEKLMSISEPEKFFNKIVMKY